MAYTKNSIFLRNFYNALIFWSNRLFYWDECTTMHDACSNYVHSSPLHCLHMCVAWVAWPGLGDWAQAIMTDCKFPPSLWGECVQTAAYLKDHTLTHTQKDKTPYEMYYARNPELSHLHELGCKAFVLIHSGDPPKLYSRSVEYVLVGYSPNSKAFRCWNKQTRHITVSRNIHFIES